MAAQCNENLPPRGAPWTLTLQAAPPGTTTKDRSYWGKIFSCWADCVFCSSSFYGAGVSSIQLKCPI
eukprot:1305142-Ditylum_brightwellii.AAC.1